MDPEYEELQKKQKEEAKKVIETLVNFLSKNDSYAARSVWNIITALRGPDFYDSDDNIKLSFTAPLRNAIGIKHSARINIETVEFGNQGQFIGNELKKELTYDQLSKSAHFKFHYEEAIISYNYLYDKEFYEKNNTKT